MSTRHLSTEGAYPFIPPLTGNIRALAVGIADMYVVVQGDPTGNGATVPYPVTTLVSAVASGPGIVLTFRSIFTSGDFWDYTFTIADVSTPGLIEQVVPVGGDVTGMLVYNSRKLADVSLPENTAAEVEPARIQWHVESTAEMLFRNITRCNSVEDDQTLVDVLNTTELGDDVLRLEDGYNTTVSVDDTAIYFEAGAGIGKGRMSDLGNTTPGSCPEPDLNAVVEGVLSINGLLPINGDLPLSVSEGLYIERTPGSILIRKR
jgi:hypothetical protein